jgi:hypothetical protein
MIDHWKDFKKAIRNRYGHWSSSERSRMLELIKHSELYIEKARKKDAKKPDPV